MRNAISWVEIPATDINRAIKFYSEILDSEIVQQNVGDFQMAFLPSDMEGVGGAITYGPDYTPAQTGVLVYLNGGEDLDVILARIDAAGGKVLVPKTLITEEYGYFGLFIDSEGNKLGLHSMH